MVHPTRSDIPPVRREELEASRKNGERTATDRPIPKPPPAEPQRATACLSLALGALLILLTLAVVFRRRAVTAQT